MKPRYEIAGILEQYGEAFRNRNKLSAHQLRVLSAIEQCRTSALGGHKDACDQCGHIRITYNSCRNRHCPKCQTTDRERWIMDRENDLLPVKYFHVVFTLPDTLNSLCMHYPKILYDNLFQAAWETIRGFSINPKFTGADAGMIAILHTWGQNLSLHPHLHCIVPGGGLTIRNQWKQARNNGKYLFPVEEMSNVFRAKFVAKLRQWNKENNLSIKKKLFQDLFKKNWVVYCPPSIENPSRVIEYLARYTHKIAISNHRLENINDGKIVFRYKDYRDAAKQKIMTLDSMEFIRRFTLHILPPGYRRIRHYGILSSRNKTKSIQCVRSFFGVPAPTPKSRDWKEISKIRTGFDPDLCPRCKKGRMQLVEHYLPKRGPPYH